MEGEEMTVRELIEKLEELPLYHTVLIQDGDTDGYMPYEGEPTASQDAPVVFL